MNALLIKRTFLLTWVDKLPWTEPDIPLRILDRKHVTILTCCLNQSNTRRGNSTVSSRYVWTQYRRNYLRNMEFAAKLCQNHVPPREEFVQVNTFVYLGSCVNSGARIVLTYLRYPCIQIFASTARLPLDAVHRCGRCGRRNTDVLVPLLSWFCCNMVGGFCQHCWGLS